MSAANPETPTSPSPPIVRRKSNRTAVYALVAVLLVVVLIAAVAVEAGWFTSKKSPAKGGAAACPTGVTLSQAGAAFVNSLVTNWATQFASATGNQVSYNPAGSGTGITDLQDGQVDLASTDDPLNATQTAAFPSQLLTLPVTGGALTLIYTLPGVTTPLNLSGPVVADILTGAITAWNDPRIADNNTGVSLPSNTIVPIVRSDQAGTTFVLTDFLSQESPAWASKVGKGIQVHFPVVTGEEQVKGNSLELTTVEKTNYGFGYSDLTDTLAAGTLQYARVLNPSGSYILPTLADTASAIADKSQGTTFPGATGSWESVSMVNAPGTGDYPLATLAYFFVYQDLSKGYQPSTEKAQVIWQWLNWTIGPGQALAAGYDYVSIPSALVTIDQAGLASLTYGGTPLTACG